jgi:hypothetical protein
MVGGYDMTMKKGFLPAVLLAVSPSEEKDRAVFCLSMVYEYEDPRSS